MYLLVTTLNSVAGVFCPSPHVTQSFQGRFPIQHRWTSHRARGVEE